MNTIVPARPSATAAASTRPGGQPPVQSNAVGAWDATYADAQAGAGSSSGSRRPGSASGSMTAGSTDGEQEKTAPAPHQAGNAQSNSAIGTVMARQGTLTPKGSGTPISEQPDGDDIAAGHPTAGVTTPDDPSAHSTPAADPTAGDQSADADQPVDTTTTGSRGKTTNGTGGSMNGQVAKMPDTRDETRTDKQDRADLPAEGDKAADQDASTDGDTASGSSKPGPDTLGPLRTSKSSSRPVQTKHAPSDAASGDAASANPQVALSQAALAANSSGGTAPARKTDDRDSTIIAVDGTSGAAAPPSLPAPPTVHSTTGAQDPEPPAQDQLRHTAANLATDGGGTARIVLTPPTLGHVEVRVTMAPSGAAHIAITAATADGYAALTASHAGLLQHLAQRGVSVGSVQTQLQGDAGKNGTSGEGGRQRHNQPTPAAPWVKKGQDETVIAYA
jgi:hypothetical protein